MSTAIRGERERAPEGKVWMGSEEACGEGNRKRKRGKKKKRKRENMRKIEKKKKRRKNYFIQFKSYITKHSTAAEELQKVQQQIFNFYLTISSSILYICNRTSKFYK